MRRILAETRWHLMGEIGEFSQRQGVILWEIGEFSQRQGVILWERGENSHRDKVSSYGREERILTETRCHLMG